MRAAFTTWHREGLGWEVSRFRTHTSPTLARCRSLGSPTIHTDKHRCVDSKHLYGKVWKPRRHPDSCGFKWRPCDGAPLGAKIFKYPPKVQVHLKDWPAASDSWLAAVLYFVAAPASSAVVSARSRSERTTPPWQRRKKAVCHTRLFMCPRHKID